MAWKIANYDELYKPYDKSGRDLKYADWVKLPAKPKGDGLQTLLEYKRGIEVFAVWCLLLEKTTKEKPENRGKLLNHKGEAASAEEIAKGISLPRKASLVLYSLSVLTTMGWVQNNEAGDIEGHRVPKSCTKSRVEKSRVEKSSVMYDNDNKCFINISPEKRKKWEEAFPAVDIGLELKSAALWVDDNPTKKKTQWGRFLTNWFRRNQEKGGSRGTTATKKTKLFPIPGKKCGQCPLPAVYKDSSGAYDSYHCLEHCPKAVKEKYY